jgi:hypothetical protein
VCFAGDGRITTEEFVVYYLKYHPQNAAGSGDGPSIFCSTICSEDGAQSEDPAASEATAVDAATRELSERREELRVLKER